MHENKDETASEQKRKPWTVSSTGRCLIIIIIAILIALLGGYIYSCGFVGMRTCMNHSEAFVNVHPFNGSKRREPNSYTSSSLPVQPHPITSGSLRHRHRRSHESTLGREHNVDNADSVEVSKNGHMLREKNNKSARNSTITEHSLNRHQINKLCDLFNDRKRFDPQRFNVDGQSDNLRESPTAEYLKLPCLQQRQDLAANRMALAGCRRVIEVGSYATPVVDNPQFKKGDVYVNVDPSTSPHVAKGQGGDGFAQLALPVTLQEFVSTLESTNSTIPDGVREPFWEPFDCLLLLGAQRQDFDKQENRLAFADVARYARMVILEANGATQYAGLSIGSPVLTHMGFKRTETPTMDCSSYATSFKLPANQLVRKMEVFVKKPAISGTPYCKQFPCS